MFCFNLGKPADVNDETNPDWIPNQNLGYLSISLPSSSSSRQRYLRARERSQNRNAKINGEGTTKNVRSTDENVSQSLMTSVATVQCTTKTNSTENVSKSLVSSTELQFADANDRKATNDPSQTIVHFESDFVRSDNVNEKECQTDLTVEDCNSYDINAQFLQSENERLHEIVLSKKIRLEAFVNDDDKTCFFTGISSFVLMKAIFKKIENDLPTSKKLTKFEIFYITLVRMRHDLSFTYLAYQFDTNREIISKYWHKGLEVLYYRLRGSIVFPSRADIAKTMPVAFQMAFDNKITIIIDCFEVFIQKSSNIKTANQTWSNYKHNHTAKYLIGTSPQGVIIFISDAFGGRASDKFITENSGFLDHIKEGDVIMADRGFLIENALASKGANLQMPAFTKGCNQLHPIDVEKTRKIANVRILVERIIGQIRLKYPIFKNRQFPMHFLCESDNYSVSIIDQMITVVCALINFCKPVYSKEMASLFEHKQ